MEKLDEHFNLSGERTFKNSLNVLRVQFNNITYSQFIMSPRCGAFNTFSGRSLLMLVTMSNNELHRLPIIQTVIEKRLWRRNAA